MPVRTLPLAVLALLFAMSVPSRSQETAIEKFKAMSGDPDALDNIGKDREKQKAPFDFYRSRVAPFDVLPFVKRHHWSTLTLEMKANLGDYDGILQTAPDVNGRPQIKLQDMPHAMVFRRETRLVKGQETNVGMQIMLPDVGKKLFLELTRPDSIRGDGFVDASIQKLETHQMLIPLIANDPSLYSQFWARFQATLPTSGDMVSGSSEIEKQRYYRLVTPDLKKLNLSTQPLTWTTTSHLIWDGVDPAILNSGQQTALVDWLHLGGQLIIVAAGPNAVAPLEDSFLAPYLPASLSGSNASLVERDLLSFSSSYPPPLWPNEFDETLELSGVKRNPNTPNPARYKPSVPVKPAPKRPVILAGLTPKPNAVSIPMNDPGNHPVAVEWRVGRGRVLMLAINPLDPAFAAWPGMDTFVRRVLLRRTEEPYDNGSDRRVYSFLSGPDLTWMKILARDLNSVPIPDPEAQNDPSNPNRNEPVAAWIDTAPEGLPVAARKALENASGITIPSSTFVLKVILAYLIALVPLNWLICRYVFHRKEWAWIAVPVLALGCAVAVERAAAYDMGFDSDCTEIDVLEIQGKYPRGHLSRFAALYSNGREKYKISYPSDPSALILPLNKQVYIRGEESALSTFESFPDPALSGFQVQPRSLSMFRSEAIVNLAGVVSLTGDIASGKLENGTGLDLRDAVLIDTATGNTRELGTITTGEVISLADPRPLKTNAESVGWTDPLPFLRKVSDYRWNGPEDRGEIRLVAWTPEPHAGQKIEPKPDRVRGFRLVVAHVRYELPDHTRPPYYSPSPATTDVDSQRRDFISLNRRRPVGHD